MYADLLDGCYHNKSILWMKSARSYGFVVAVAVALFIVINELVDFYGLRYVGTKRTTQIGVHTARNNSWAGDRTTTTVNINNVVICKCGLTFYLCLFKNALCISDFWTVLGGIQCMYNNQDVTKLRDITFTPKYRVLSTNSR